MIPGWCHRVEGPLPQSYFASRWVHSWGIRAVPQLWFHQGTGSQWSRMTRQDCWGVATSAFLFNEALLLIWCDEEGGGQGCGKFSWSCAGGQFLLLGGQPDGDHSFIPQILLLIHVSSLMMIRWVYVSLATTSILRLSVNFNNNSHWQIYNPCKCVWRGFLNTGIHLILVFRWSLKSKVQF